MLKTDTELTRDTKTLKVVDVENRERRIESAEIEVINKNISSRMFETKNCDRKRCDLKTNNSIKNELFELDCRDLKLKKKAARETAIF